MMKKAYKKTHLPEAIWGETACFFNDESLDGITAELENAEIGEKFQVEIVELKKGEIEKMPEFEGW